MNEEVGRKLLIKNLPHEIDNQCIALNVEHLLGGNDNGVIEDQICFSPGSDQALVPLEQHVDMTLADLQRMAQKDRMPTVRQFIFCPLPPPRLLLYNIHPKHHFDVLELYLESTKSGNRIEAEIKKPADISEDGTTAIIEFEDSQAMDLVLKQENHNVMNERIYIRRCTPFTTLDNFHLEDCHPLASDVVIDALDDNDDDPSDVPFLDPPGSADQSGPFDLSDTSEQFQGGHRETTKPHLQDISTTKNTGFEKTRKIPKEEVNHPGMRLKKSSSDGAAAMSRGQSFGYGVPSEHKSTLDDRLGRARSPYVREPVRGTHQEEKRRVLERRSTSVDYGRQSLTAYQNPETTGATYHPLYLEELLPDSASIPPQVNYRNPPRYDLPPGNAPDDYHPALQDHIEKQFVVKPHLFGIVQVALKFYGKLREVQGLCKISPSKQRNTFELAGTSDAVYNAHKALSEVVDSMVEGEIPTSLDLAQKLCRNPGRRELIDIFRASKPRQICARVHIRKDKAFVVGLEKRDFEGARLFLSSKIVTEIMKLSSDQLQKLSVIHLRSCEGNASIMSVTDGGLQLEGLTQAAVDEMKAKVSQLIPAEQSLDFKIRLNAYQWRLLKQNGGEKIDRELNKFGNGIDKLTWSFSGSSDNDPALKISGTKSLVDKARRSLEKNNPFQVFSDNMKIEKPGLREEHFFTRHVQKFISTIEQSLACIIERETGVSLDLPSGDSDEQLLYEMDDVFNPGLDDDEEEETLVLYDSSPPDDEDDVEEAVLPVSLPSLPNLQVIKGDIAAFGADVLVNTLANNNSDLVNCGALSKSFAEAGGSIFQQEFTNNIGTVENGQVVAQQTANSQSGYLQSTALALQGGSTQSYGSLKSKHILHMGIRSWTDRPSQQPLPQQAPLSRARTPSRHTNKEMLTGMIEDCLSKTKQLGLTSIAFPTIGGGKFKYPAEAVASCFRQCLPKYPGIKVTVVAYGGEACYAYKQQLGIVARQIKHAGSDSARKRRPSSTTGHHRRSSRSGLGQGHRDSRGHGTRTTSLPSQLKTDTIKLSIHSLEKDKILTAMHEIYKDIIPMVYETKEISLNSDDALQKAARIASQMGCKADVQGNKITLAGAKSCVGKANEEVLKKCFVVTKTFTKTQLDSGYTLEALWKIKQEKGVNAYLKALSDEKILTPDYWKNSPKTPITRLLTGSSQTGPMQNTVTLDSRSKAYNVIQKLVVNTWQNVVGHGKDAVGLSHSSIAISKIQRIENPHLFRDYATKRATFCMKADQINPLPPVKSNPGDSDMMVSEVNEVFLFHGTSTDTLDAVIHQGIDDRMSGDNTLFGRGSYFAESSTKADQYTDSKRKRVSPGTKLNMIITRVLLGNAFTCQNPQPFKRAPCMTCKTDACTTGGHVFYDSVLGTHKPGNIALLFREFVIYDKAQCYPEYVVEYTRQ